MVDIEPFDYQKTNNIDEHKQIVNKVNEVVDVINGAELDNIPEIIDDVNTIKESIIEIDDAMASKAEESDVIAVENRVTTVENTINQHTTQINANASDIASAELAITEIQHKDTAQDTSISNNASAIVATDNKIPTAYQLYRTGDGKIQLQSTAPDGTVNSNILDMIIPMQFNIVTGTTDRSFKIQIVYSDGTTTTTNDMVIPEGGGTDVSITSVTLQDQTDSNSFKVVVGLSDGSTIESGAIEKVESVAGTVTNGKLTITVNGIASVPITLPTIDLEAGNGIIVNGGTISVDTTTVALKTDLTSYATTEALTTAQTALSNKDIKSITLAISGQALSGTITLNDNTTIGIPAINLPIPDLSNYATKAEVSAIGITSNGNTLTVNGKTANAINSVSGSIDENNNLIITINGISGSGIPLPNNTANNYLFLFNGASTVSLRQPTLLSTDGYTRWGSHTISPIFFVDKSGSVITNETYSIDISDIQRTKSTGNKSIIQSEHDISPFNCKCYGFPDDLITRKFEIHFTGIVGTLQTETAQFEDYVISFGVFDQSSITPKLKLESGEPFQLFTSNGNRSANIYFNKINSVVQIS